MLAELHLAEDALGLHLLLQRPEGLIDIVVADENLHVVFLAKSVDVRMSLYSIRPFSGNEKAEPKNGRSQGRSNRLPSVA